MDPQQTPPNLPFADDDAKLEAELADPTPPSPPPSPLPQAPPSMSSPPSPPPTPPAAPSPINTMDPEDIFSDLEQKRPLSSMNRVLPIAPAASGSMLKYVLIALGILVVCGAVAGAIWYFAIHRSTRQVIQQEMAPVIPEPIPNEEPVPPPAPPPTVPPEVPEAPVYVPSIPVTSTPEAANVPPPEDLARQDTDKDGLTDVRENELGTDATKVDSDGDALTDGEEVMNYRTNPLNSDSDADSYPDGVEVKKGYNPLGAGKCTKPDCTL